MAKWLRTASAVRLATRLAEMIPAAFDIFFGHKHLSWRCFRRSMLVSIVSVFAIYLLLLARTPEQLMLHAGAWIQPHPKVVVTGIFVFCATVIPDYLSLLETRFVLGYLRRYKSWKSIVSLLSVDVIFTTVIARLGLFLLNVGLRVIGRYVPPRNSRSITIDDLFVQLTSTITDMELTPGLFPIGTPSETPSGFLQMSVAPWFYGTFATSAWTWLLVLSFILLAVAQRVDFVAARLRKVLDIDTKPMLSMGAIASVLAALFTLVLCLFL